MKKILLICLLLLTVSSSRAMAGDTVWLDDLNLDQSIQTSGHPVRNLNCMRQPMSIAGQKYVSGVGVQAKSEQWLDVGRGAGHFIADVGVDDDGKQGSVEFIVGVDGAIVWRSGVMNHGDPAKHIDLDVSNKNFMCLVCESAHGQTDQNYGDWANAHFDTVWSDPVQAIGDNVDPYILTPEPGKGPHLNNALTYGTRPNYPMQYTIPCTGIRPIDFSVTGLPKGLTLDKTHGWIVGTPTTTGIYPLVISAKNADGESTKQLKIVVGDALALTPPMGWSTWNAWCAAPSQSRVLDAARSFVKFDLINHGFTYVNIDDGWEGLRGGKFNGIQPNEKFPNFPAMIKEVHNDGLKLGVYSGPWICSYCGYTGGSSDDPNGKWTTDLRNLPNNGWEIGKYNLAKNDANEWASWGVDYLKYDWYPQKEPEVAAMSNALRDSGRNIVYSISNSSNLGQGPMLVKYSQLWRASNDIRDNWPSLYSNGFSQSPWSQYAGPGHWADPDMMVLGNVGFGSKWGSTTHPSGLTPDEQYTHMSLWCMLAAPLVLGCDLTKLDPFTLGLLTNDDVVAVDQDPLGKAAVKISSDYFHEVWMRPLYDGSYVVAIFNISPGKAKSAVALSELGLKGDFSVRDLWREQNLGAFGDSFTTDINGHGVRMIQLTPIKR